ncbi:hypothetical protein ACH5RR_030132, partial [Cinchona calisaya]
KRREKKGEGKNAAQWAWEEREDGARRRGYGRGGEDRGEREVGKRKGRLRNEKKGLSLKEREKERRSREGEWRGK